MKKIEKVWLEKSPAWSEGMENPAIRVDLSDNHHFRVEIEQPHSLEEVGLAFVEMGYLIGEYGKANHE